MKKIILGLVALSAVSFAQSDMYINARIGGDFGAKYNTQNNDFNDKTDGFGEEVALEGYKTTFHNFDLGLGVAFQVHADRKNHITPDFKTYSGLEYNSIPIYLTAKYSFDINSQIKPYLKANLGYSFNVNSSDYRTKFEGGSEEYSSTVDNGMYWGVGGGAEYKNFTLDLMYVVTNAKSDDKVNSGKIDNDYRRIVLSAGYRFNI